MNTENTKLTQVGQALLTPVNQAVQIGAVVQSARENGKDPGALEALEALVIENIVEVISELQRILGIVVVRVEPGVAVTSGRRVDLRAQRLAGRVEDDGPASFEALQHGRDVSADFLSVNVHRGRADDEGPVGDHHLGGDRLTAVDDRHVSPAGAEQVAQHSLQSSRYFGRRIAEQLRSALG